MADDRDRPASITFDGDVSNGRLGTLRTTTKPELQAQLNATDYSAEKKAKVTAQMRQTANSAAAYVRSQQAVRTANLRDVSRSQVQRPTPVEMRTRAASAKPAAQQPVARQGAPQGAPQAQKNRTAPAARAADEKKVTRDAPAKISGAKNVSRRELGTFRVPTKAQHQSQLNALSYSDTKRQNINAQWQQTASRAKDFVQTRQAERAKGLNQVARTQQRVPAGVKSQANNLGQVAQTKQRAAEQNVFDRYGPKAKQVSSLRSVAQNQSPASPTTSMLGRKKLQNVFDKHQPQHNKVEKEQIAKSNKVQQQHNLKNNQEKGRDRER